MEVDHVKLIKVNGPLNKSQNKITFEIQQHSPVETENMFSTSLDKVSKLRMNCKGDLARIKPITLHTMFHNAIDKGANTEALKYKYSQENSFLSINYSQYYQLCCMAAKSLIQIGLNARKSVCISGHNSPEWFITYFGTIFAGGVASGIYVTNNKETVEFIINNCECIVAIVANEELLKKYVCVSKNCPNLKAIVYYGGLIDDSIKGGCKISLYDWTEFMNLGININDDTLIGRLNHLIPNECCSLIYTSGTTGNPKGVMMSHDNLVWTAECMLYYMKFRHSKEMLISYLPLSHVAAQMCDIIIPLLCQATIHFAQPDALKGSLGHTLKEVHPTYFIGVPRVFEKIMEQMKEMAIDFSSVKKSISSWAKDIGYRTNLAKMMKEDGPFGYSIAKCVIFNKVHKALGFDRCLGIFSAAAPLSHDVLVYFASLDLVICEIYGMSECSGPQTIEFQNEFRFGSVGKILPDFGCKLDSEDGKEGEICMYGRHVFMGYVNAPEKTKEVFDSEYWLHSGDVGTFNDEGYLFITGRIKELLITAGGENIAPVPIEQKIKENLDFISNAMVVGDKRKYLCVLLTIKCVIDPVTQIPTDDLTPAAKRWFSGIGYNPTSISQIITDKNPKLSICIDEGIKRSNENAISRSAEVQKWTFLPHDFSVPGGELGPTLKLKRNVVNELYSALINSLYE